MLLTKKGLRYVDILVSQDPAAREKMIALSGNHQVPQILINDKLIGGFDELYLLEESGDLDELLKQEK
jgi:glutaredoxin 3